MPTVQTRPITFTTSPVVSGVSRPAAEPIDKVDKAHSLQQGDQFKPGDTQFPWQFQSDILALKRPALVERLKEAKPDVLRALNDLSLMAQLPYPGADDTRAPHQVVRSALALALQDKQIDVGEASEIRGLMLTLLPPQERAKYASFLALAPMSRHAEAILKKIDPDLSDYRTDFQPAELKLMASANFQMVFPNFMALSRPQQRQVMTELNVFLKHFPQLLTHLASINNTNYGPGFQFFFIPDGANADFESTIPKNATGVVMPGANVVKNPIFGWLASKIELRQLDRGGVYESAIKHGTFTHEFGHVVHLNLLNDDQRDQIKNLYDQAWNNLKAGKHGFVTNYAKTNPYEYFAEGIEYFLIGPADQLKQRDPGLHTFLTQLFQPGKVYSGKDGNLLTDPERIHMLVSPQGGQTLYGVALSRESDLVALKHFEGSVVTEVSGLVNERSAIARGSVGLKAGWKPSTKPASVYGTVGGVAQVGSLGAKLSVGAGAYAGAGVDYKGFNAEVRQNFMGGINSHSSPEVRVGWRIEF